MNSESKPTRIWYENLDTSFVNLWGLLRFLTQRSFVGRVHVELENYMADVFLNGSETPLVHEVDREAGTDVVEEAALHRLVLRVREAPGNITVYEGSHDAVPPQAESPADEVTVTAATPELMRSSSAKQATAEEAATAAAEEEVSAGDEPARAATAPQSAGEWTETSRLSGELIGAIERAAVSTGSDFNSLFRDARVALADDYTFLDPLGGSLQYENSSVTTNGEVAPRGYVAGVSEALRRVVDQLATGERERRTRERIALELARVARKNADAVARTGFGEQLDRIAGTKVI